MGGFSDPEINKKAQEKSLATRRSRKESKLAKLLEEEAKTENLPAVVDEKDVESFKDITPGFAPTINQLKVLAVALSLEHGSSIRSWFKAVGLNRNDWYGWIRNPNFVSWWNKSFTKGIEQYRGEWIAIGLKRMNNLLDPNAFNYWKNVGEKIFGYISEIKVKQDKTPEEEELVNELLKLVKRENIYGEAKQIDGEVIEIKDEIKEIENNGNQ